MTYKDNTDETITLVWVMAFVGFLVISLFATILTLIPNPEPQLKGEVSATVGS